MLSEICVTEPTSYSTTTSTGGKKRILECEASSLCAGIDFGRMEKNKHTHTHTANEANNKVCNVYQAINVVRNQYDQYDTVYGTSIA